MVTCLNITFAVMAPISLEDSAAMTDWRAHYLTNAPSAITLEPSNLDKPEPRRDRTKEAKPQRQMKQGPSWRTLRLYVRSFFGSGG